MPICPNCGSWNIGGPCAQCVGKRTNDLDLLGPSSCCKPFEKDTDLPHADQKCIGCSVRWSCDGHYCRKMPQ